MMYENLALLCVLMRERDEKLTKQQQQQQSATHIFSYRHSAQARFNEPARNDEKEEKNNFLFHTHEGEFGAFKFIFSPLRRCIHIHGRLYFFIIIIFLLSFHSIRQTFFFNNHSILRRNATTTT